MVKKPKKKLSAYNRHVQREMKAGKSMKQAAASWSKKSGKPKAAKKASSKTRSSSKKTGGRTMAKGGFSTQKLFKVVRLAAIALPAATTLMSNNTNSVKMAKLSKDYTGYDPRDGSWEFGRLAGGYAPYLGAILATYGIPKLAGLIRGL